MKNLFVVAIVGGLAFGCSQDSPTSPGAPHAPIVNHDSFVSTSDGIGNGFVEDPHARLRTMMESMLRQRDLTDHEDFTCENVEEVRVRFSDPGFIDGLSVGLFLKFIGIPAGTKTLRIWWNFETDYDTYQDVIIGDGELNPEDPSTFDVVEIIEHGYATAGEKRVRVELILEDQTGNCSRNRDIFVTLESFDHVASFGGLASCTTFAGMVFGMGIQVNITPPLPAGTTYTVRARVDATGAGLGPTTTASFAAGPDLAFPPAQFTTPPVTFTNTWTSSVPHSQLLIGSAVFPFPTSMNMRVVAINVPGKTIGVIGGLGARCP